MLDQGAAEGHVQQLQTPTDPEHRDPPFEGLVHQRQLEGVAVRVDRTDLGHRLLAVAARGDVTPAGQDEPVDAVEDGGRPSTGSRTGSTIGTPPAATTESM